MNNDIHDQSRGKKYSVDDGSVVSSNADESQIFDSVQSMDTMLQNMSLYDDPILEPTASEAAPATSATETSIAEEVTTENAQPVPEETPIVPDTASDESTSSETEAVEPSVLSDQPLDTLVLTTPSVTEATPEPVVVSSQVDKKKPQLGLIIGIVVGVLAIAGIIFAIFKVLNTKKTDFTTSHVYDTAQVTESRK
jgi:hypothetical protein